MIKSYWHLNNHPLAVIGGLQALLLIFTICPILSMATNHILLAMLAILTCVALIFYKEHVAVILLMHDTKNIIQPSGWRQFCQGIWTVWTISMGIYAAYHCLAALAIATNIMLITGCSLLCLYLGSIILIPTGFTTGWVVLALVQTLITRAHIYPEAYRGIFTSSQDELGVLSSDAANSITTAVSLEPHAQVIQVVSRETSGVDTEAPPLLPQPTVH